ncbi:MAG: UbiA family prenyltransferase [Crocinitomicaceae bacterium]|nr:UbiA family prenyltransferase [Crocinitomicaceae bacterium]
MIALTMGVFQIYVAQGGFREALKPEFLTLVFSTLLIAAAGNIINDYFDVKADRINKPELLIIDKHIKRRWAIVFNWVFNSVGLLIAMYLGWKYDNWFMAIIPFVTINLLWFYSMYFKRTLILGNVIEHF